MFDPEESGYRATGFLAALLLLGASLSSCADDESLEGSAWIDESARGAEDGSIRVANQSFPGSEAYSPIGTPQDSLGEVEFTESCFAERPRTDPRVTTRFAAQAGYEAGMSSPGEIAGSVNDIVWRDSLMSDPADQLDLPYLDRGDPVATAVRFEHLETVFVSVDWVDLDQQTYNPAACGTESDPLTLAEFNRRCGDSYTSGWLMGGFVWIFATHPTMTSDELERLVEEFQRAGRGRLLGSADNLSTLADLGFDIRVYSHGAVDEPSGEPGDVLTPESAFAYWSALDDLRERTGQAMADERAWPHGEFGAVLAEGERPYRRNSIHRCTQLPIDSELNCYARGSSSALQGLPDWREYLQTAEERLRNPGQFDWGHDPQAVQNDYREFVHDASACIQCTDGLWSACRNQVAATPSDTEAICSSCSPRFSCDPSSASDDRCAGEPDRERIECSPGQLDRTWERLRDRVERAQ
jgi:hypothetical protein